MRLLTRRIEFILSEEHAPGGRWDPRARGLIDREGEVIVESRDREAAEQFLIEKELVEIRSAPDGDTVLLATDWFRDQLAPAFAELPDGWQTWEPEEGET
jgi:hypothetical protein